VNQQSLTVCSAFQPAAIAARLKGTKMRFTLRAFLILSAIAPLVLTYFLSPYFRPAPNVFPDPIQLIWMVNQLVS
jgi:hypothetical protein